MKKLEEGLVKLRDCILYSSKPELILKYYNNKFIYTSSSNNVFSEMLTLDYSSIFNNVKENIDINNIIEFENIEQFKSCDYILDAVKVRFCLFGKLMPKDQARLLWLFLNENLSNLDSQNLNEYWEQYFIKYPEYNFKDIEGRTKSKYFSCYNIFSFGYNTNFKSKRSPIVSKEGHLWAIDKKASQYMEIYIQTLVNIIHFFPSIEFVMPIIHDKHIGDKRQYLTPLFGFHVKNKKIRLLNREETIEVSENYLSDPRNNPINKKLNFFEALKLNLDLCEVDDTWDDILDKIKSIEKLKKQQIENNIIPIKFLSDNYNCDYRIFFKEAIVKYSDIKIEDGEKMFILDNYVKVGIKLE